MRSDTKNVKNGLRRSDARTAKLDAPVGDYAELLTIPRLGLVRAESLAASGIKSLADLRNTSESDIARVKWVGPGNAKLIKQWLTTQTPEEAPAQTTQSADVKDAGKARGRAAAEKPAGQTKVRRRKRSAAHDGVAHDISGELADRITELPADLDTSIDEPPDVSVSEALHEDIGQIDTAISRLKEAIPKKSRGKKLGRQLDKVASSVSDVPESFEVLQNKEKLAATKALDRIARLLSDAVESGKLSAKKQEAMGTELKKFRKRLVKALGG